MTLALCEDLRRGEGYYQGTSIRCGDVLAMSFSPLSTFYKALDLLSLGYSERTAAWKAPMLQLT